MIALPTVFSHYATAQPVDTTLTAFEAIASFDEAAALAIDPAGMIYVVDRGRHHIRVLSPDGRPRHTFGGPGRTEGQFDEPADIDPTNGLVLVVADAGNGRIQRFSREFLFLEALPVRAGPDRLTSGPHYRQREQDVVGAAPGRPIAVRTSPDNATYAIDASENVVLKWDVDRNLEFVIGAYDQGEGALVEPVDLAVEAGALYVADRGRAAVLVYDAFGGYDRSMADGLCRDARALALAGEGLVVALGDRLLWFHKRGRLERVVALELPEEVVDVAYGGPVLYVLGPKTLYRTRFVY